MHTPTIRPATHGYVFPASSSQQRLWFLDRLAPGQASYHVPAAVKIETVVDRAALQRAIDDLVRRHESLRTSFAEVDGRVLQVVAAHCHALLRVVEAGSLAAHEVERLTAREATQPFDLSRPPLVRVTLLSESDSSHVLVVTCHHSIADGLSLEVLFRDLATLYAAHARGRRPRLRRLPVQFADFAAWQQALTATARDGQLAYWRRALADLPECLALPVDRPRPAEQRFLGATVALAIDRTLGDELRALGKSTDATMFMVLLAGFQALLQRYSGASDIAVGSPVSGRHREPLQDVVGFFVNTLVFRTRFDDDPSGRELLARVRRTVLGGLAHQDLPFDEIVADVAPRRTLSHQPLCQVLFGLQTASAVSTAGAARQGSQRLSVETGTSKCDLTLSLIDDGGAVTGFLEFDTDLFERATIERMRDGFLQWLRGVAADPDARVSAIDLLSAHERAQLEHAWNSTARPYPRSEAVHALVGARTAAAPTSPAVVDGGVVLTYGDLQARAALLARRLEAHGVLAGHRVGVCLDRSAAMVAAWLAVLQTGAAYVPLEPTYPRPRLETLIHDAGVAVVLADARTIGLLPAGVVALAVDGPPDPGASPAAADRACRGGDAPAYVVYTSGSTGAPKGTVVPHRAVTRLVVNTNYIALGPDDRIAHASSPSFDAATFEIWGALINGASVVIVPRDVLLHPTALAAFLRAERITVLFLTTALFNQVVAECPEAFASLRCLLTGGEMADPRRFREVLERGAPGRLLHVYGPTETTTFATYHPVDEVPTGAVSIPIGRPIGNTRAYVVDERLALTPVGVAGELVVAGDGVALEYLGHPALTRAKFVDDRWRPGEGRAYRTGDLARWRADGVLEILGRLDDQVKIRGFRVEPGEVEAVLTSHPAVRQTIVVPRMDGSSKRLAAYVVPAAPTTASALRAFLADRLPDYMVPSAIVLLERLPMSGNGKVDRAALPVPDARPLPAAATPPTTSVEATLVSVWADVLHVDDVGVHDNFFELGGDSICAIQIVSRAARAGLRFTPRQLFKHQTIAELASAVGEALPDVDQGLVTGEVPLTPIQHWFLERAPVEPHHFNQATIVDVPSTIDAGTLEAAAQGLARHHDALRLRFERTAHGWRQWIAPPDTAPLVGRFDVSQEDRPESAIARLATEVQRGLDLGRGPLLRMALFWRGADQPARLLIVVHHLAVDVVSWQILLDDLRRALAQCGAGTPIELPAKTASFKVWAERLAALGTDPPADAPAWWESDGWPHCRLPRDVEPHDDDNIVGHRRTWTSMLDPSATSALLGVAGARRGAEMQHLVAAGVVAALARWTGGRACALDVEGHGRDLLDDALDVSRTVGWFTSITPVLFAPPFLEPHPWPLVQHVAERMAAAPRGARAYGVLRYLARDEGLRARAAAVGEVAVAFNYMGRVDGRGSASGGDDAAVPTGLTRSERGRRRHLVEIDGGVVGDRLVLHWSYSSAIHLESTIARVAGDCSDVLGRVAALSGTGEGADRAGAESDDRFGVSPLQEGMLFHTLLEPRAGQYIVLMSVPLAAGLDVTVFRAAWAYVIDRHAILRTSFTRDGAGVAAHLVARAVTPAWEVLDWRGLPAQERDEQLQAYLTRERVRGFDPTEPPLMRFALVRMSDDEWRFIWVCHHLLLDGWSRPLVLSDVAEAHEALGAGRAPALPSRRPYRDYIEWLAGRDRDASARFWTAQLAGFAEPTSLLAALAPAAASAHGAHARSATGYTSIACALSADTTARLQATLRQLQVTLGTAVHGAWAVLLAAYCRRLDVVFGSTASGRPADLEGVEGMIGPFINTIPARVSIAPATPVGRWLQALQTRLLHAREFEHAPLVETQACSEVPHGTPLFDSLLVVENYPGLPAGEASGTRATSTEWTNYPITLSAIPGESLTLEITHASSIDAAAVTGLLDQLTCFLSGIAVDVEQPLGEVPLMSVDERRRVLVDWNRAGGCCPEDDPTTLVAQAAERRPAAVAVRCGAHELTYGDLRAAVGTLARALAAIGVGRDQRVGVFLDRSLELPVAMLAVLERGAAYVPLDPAWPRDRVAWHINDAGLEVCVTSGRLSAELAAMSVRTLVVDVPRLVAEGKGGPSPRERASLHPDDPAYVVYTSGTTGVPKGVVVSRRSVATHAQAMVIEYGLTAADRVLHAASPAFDVAVEEIVPALAAGATVVVWSDGALPSVPELLAFASTERLTVLNLPTPYWHEWADQMDRGQAPVPPSVRLVVVGTDRANPETVSRWLARAPHHVRWCNAYGCTEATVTSTTFAVNGGGALSGDGAVPIGRPVANTRVYVVDESLRPVPIGVPGELVVAGDGVALGYWQRPDETAARFIAEQWRREGGRGYRTGDLARWRPDGLLELLGRLDDQIKIRGYRIEPREIEAAIAREPGVRHVAVVSQPHHGDARLVAYVVSDRAFAPDAVGARLRERLPAYMIPSAFVPLDALPMTANGKLDRRALPGAVFGPTPRDYVAPRTDMERVIAAIWAEVLGVSTPGAEDNFFHLGGHSLTATRVVSRVRQSCGLEVPLRAAFEHPTLAGFAAFVAASTTATAGTTIRPRSDGGPCPLSFAQERLWFLDQLSPGSALYNLPCSLHIDGELDVPAMAWGVNEVVRRHDALRTTFTVVDGCPAQVVVPSLRVPLDVIDLAGLDEAARTREARRIGIGEARRPFDLQQGPLIRAVVLRLGAREHVLLTTMHHIVSDGWSIGVLLRELQAGYDARVRGRAHELRELPIQYADYAAWQRASLTGDALGHELAFWRRQLAGAPPALDLPTDRPRPPQRRFRGAYDAVTVPHDLTAAIRALGEREGATLFMIVLAAWRVILSRWSGQEDVSVGVPVAGRHRGETEDLIGFFLNNLVIRTTLDGDLSCREWLARVRETALEAFAHQDLPFEMLLADLAPPRDLSRTPLFQAYLNVLTFADERMDLPAAVAESFSLTGGESAPEDGDAARQARERREPDVWSQFDLTLYAAERDGRVRFVLVYDTDLFTRARMAEMLDQLVSVLAQVVEQPEAPVSQLTLTTDRATAVLPDPKAPLDDTWLGSVAQQCASQAAQMPDRVAVEDATDVVTYRELDRRSNQLAHALGALGVSPGDLVAIHAARCASLPWALLGVMKAGAAFTVLDPGHPPARLVAQLEVAGPRAVVLLEAAGALHADIEASLRASRVAHVLLPSFAAARSAGAFDAFPETCPAVDVGANDTACVGFTSGSMGVPKGVVGRHGSLTHFVPWLTRTFDLGAQDRFSMLSGLSHDPLQREVFTPLCLGARIVIPSTADYAEAPRLAAWVAASGTTVAHLTPALGQLLVQGAGAAPTSVHWPGLRTAFFVGDVLRYHDVARLAEVAPGMTCVNYYGTTETQRAVGYTVVRGAGAEQVEPGPHGDPALPLGRGIDDVQLLVRDTGGRQCGIGELGEICVRSPHLAKGYLGDDDLTRERFLVNPVTGQPHDRLYRTGDLGRYLPDGAVAFAGRRDAQVKIRGFRVELQEIEAVLSQHAVVHDVKVVARRVSADDRQLVAYVVPRPGRVVTPGELTQWVGSRLPAYMVPSHVVPLAVLPVTPNGKIDVGRLPPPDAQPDAPVAPRTALEHDVADLWGRLPGVVVAGVHAGFFESGGHSLLSTVLLSKVRARFGVDIHLSQFVAAPTIAALAAAIDAAGTRADDPPLCRLPRRAYRVPLTENGAPVLLPDRRRQLLSAFNGGRPR